MFLDLEEINDSLKGWNFEPLPCRKWCLNMSSATEVKNSYQNLKKALANHVTKQKTAHPGSADLAGYWDFSLMDAQVDEVISLF